VGGSRLITHGLLSSLTPIPFVAYSQMHQDRCLQIQRSRLQRKRASQSATAVNSTRVRDPSSDENIIVRQLTFASSGRLAITVRMAGGLPCDPGDWHPPHLQLWPRIDCLQPCQMAGSKLMGSPTDDGKVDNPWVRRSEFGSDIHGFEALSVLAAWRSIRFSFPRRAPRVLTQTGPARPSRTFSRHAGIGRPR